LICFFIPALWQGYTVEPTLFYLFLKKPWDACELESNRFAPVFASPCYATPVGRSWQGKLGSE
jgi:hypothetical protein